MKNLTSYLFKTNAFRVCEENKPFWYTSGKIGPYFVNGHFLYGNEEIKLIIEAERSEECHRKALWHDKYDKTSKSKDVIIESKDRYIKKLEVEIEQLRKEINQLRALIYDKK